MKTLYVTKKEVWQDQAKHLNGAPMVHHVKRPDEVYLDTDGVYKTRPGGYEPVPVHHYELFNPRTGSHYIELEDGHILLATCVDHSEHAAEIWHSNDQVARLPHPIYEGQITLESTLSETIHRHKKFRKKHFEVLEAHSGLTAKLHDTVLDLARKAKKIKPDVTIAV